MPRPDVVLVVPPLQGVARPNLGVSYLVAALDQAGFSTRARYLNLHFAQTIGLPLNEWLTSAADCRWLLGEWLFAAEIGPAAARSDPGRYFAEVVSELPPELPRVLRAVRGQVGRWLDRQAAALVAQRPLLLGFTSSFEQTCAALALARRVKALCPELPVALGGANCRGPMAGALAEAFPQLDYVFDGEAEQTLPRLAERLARGETPARGGWPCPPLSELDALPLPRFEHYFDQLACQDFARAVRPALVLEGSRGCAWAERRTCRFCSTNGRHPAHRRKSTARLAGELRTLCRRHGVHQVQLVDPALDLAPGGHGEALAAGAAEGELRAFCGVRTSASPAALGRAARAGLSWVQAGVESLDDALLALLDKGSTALQNLRFLRTCQELGVKPLWLLLHGIPGEQDVAYRRIGELVPRVVHLAPPQWLYPVRLDRFSRYFDAGRGFEGVAPAPAYRHLFDLPEPLLARLAFFFEGEPVPRAGAGALAALRRAVEGWQALHRPGVPAPRLELVHRGGLTLLEDTRPGAGERYAALCPAELDLLARLRRPRQVERLIAGEPTPEAAATLARLEQRGLVLQRGGRALSLVCDASSRVHPPGGWETFPGGTANP